MPMLKKDISSSISSSVNETITSNAQNINSYYASSKLERDKMYSEILETYQNLLANNATSEEQKSLSTKEINTINNRKNSIMIAENLIKNLGFDDVVIFVNDNSVSVVVRADTLQEADVAQIQNIVCREISVPAEIVHISVK